MAYRLTYAPNTQLPIAISLSAPAKTRFYPLGTKHCSPIHQGGPTRTLHLATDPIAPQHGPDETSDLNMLAVDSIMLDADIQNPATTVSDLASIYTDHFWFHASFRDPWDRAVQIRGRDHLPVVEGVEFFGGVITNQVTPTDDAHWIFMPLKAWGSFEITIDDHVHDSEVLGVTELFHDPRALRLTLYPWQIRQDGGLFPRPLSTAEDVGLAGLIIEWENAPYQQAPTVAVRAERGDTVESIADDMAVDTETIIRANAVDIAPDQPLKGKVLRVPLIGRAAPKNQARSTSLALTWHEMVHGWTTLN